MPSTLIALTALGHLLDRRRSARRRPRRRRLRGQPTDVVRRGDLALGVVGEGGLPEPDGRGVGLVAADEEGQQPGGPARRPSTSTPVAIGSSVPAWPTRRVPPSRRTWATTSWLVQPAGLSTTSSPSAATAGRAAVIGPSTARRVHAGPGGVRVVRGSSSTSLARAVDRLAVRVGVAGVGWLRWRPAATSASRALAARSSVVDVRGVLGQRVGEELQRRGEPHADAACRPRCAACPWPLQRGGGRRALLLAAEDRVEDRRVLQVAGDPGVGDGDEAQPRVLDPGLERLGDDDLDPVGDLAGPCAGQPWDFLSSVSCGRCRSQPCRRAPRPVAGPSDAAPSAGVRGRAGGPRGRRPRDPPWGPVPST